MLVAKELGIPGMLEVNSPLVKEQATHRVLHNVTDAMACVRRSFQHASAVIAVSADVALFARAEGATNVHIVPNGVDVQRFHPSVVAARLPSHTNSGQQVIGFVGTLKPWHGVELLLEAFAMLAPRISNTMLLIVGDGPLLVPLKARAVALNIADKVVFTGAVRSDEVPSFVRAMDVAVAPYPQSSDSYFSPLKLYEYMACGRAIVASRIGQIPEQVLGDPLLRTRLGLAARLQGEQQHSWTSVAERILTIAESSKGANVCAL
jgi:glycosyltransferase involved in cell wall biosynthesis